jgi:hypothetical protein
VLVSSFEWFWMILGGDGWYYEAVSGRFGWFKWWHHWVSVPQGHFGSFCGGEYRQWVVSGGGVVLSVCINWWVLRSCRCRSCELRILLMWDADGRGKC